MQAWLRVGGLSVAMLLVACAELSPIEAGSCGNGVLESGEDCDRFVDPTLGPDTQCGAPGAANECRYVCDEAKCPTGSSCGTDGVCRKASGTFELSAAAFAWDPESFEIGDFDGDERQDLLGSFPDRIELRRGRDGFASSESLPMISITGLLATGNLDGDERDDIVVPTTLGLEVLSGELSGAPSEVTYAPFSLSPDSWAIPLRTPLVAPENVLLLLSPQGNGTQAQIFTFKNLSAAEAALVDPTRAVTSLPPDLPTADLDNDGGDEFAIAFPGGSTVQIWGIHKDMFALQSSLRLGGFGATHNSASPVVVDLAAATGESGITVERGARFVQMDANDKGPFVDLLVSVSDDRVLVATSDGSGTFEYAIDPRFEALKTDGGSRWPLAGADLDNDGLADFVGSEGIYLTSIVPGALIRTEARVSGAPWTAAVIDDFDADGKLDVAAISDGENVVHVYLCQNADSDCRSNGGLFGGRYYSTEAPVTRLRSGYLQGGGADLIVGEKAQPGVGERDSVWVLFSDPLEAPSPPKRIGRFDSLTRMEIGKTRYADSPIVDLYDDVVVESASNDGLALGVLFSTGAKQLFSPYSLSSGLTFHTPNRALAGHFLSALETDPLDLVAIGSTLSSSRLWVIEGAPRAAFAPVERSQSLRADLDPAFAYECSRWTVADLDGDQRNEAVAVFGGQLGPEPNPALPLRIAIGSVDTNNMEFSVEPLSLDLDRLIEIVALDLDGDGKTELVLLEPTRARVTQGKSSSNRSFEDVVFPSDAGEASHAAVFARPADATGGRSLAIVTQHAVLELARRPAELEVRAVTTELGGSAVRSADINRDGLGDLLVLEHGALRLLTAVEAPPGALR